jgi:hypothetical protein
MSLLTPARRAVIAATAPAVAGNINLITPVFYKTMFKSNPEVLQFFNLSNQVRKTKTKFRFLFPSVHYLTLPSFFSAELSTARSSGKCSGGSSRSFG